MTLFENVQKAAKQRGLSIRALNEKAQLGTNAIYKWKTQNPSTDKLQAVADVLGVSVDYLLGNTDDMHKTKNEDPSTPELIAAHWGIDLDNLSKEEKAIVMARARDYVKGLVDAFESK